METVQTKPNEETEMLLRTIEMQQMFKEYHQNWSNRAQYRS